MKVSILNLRINQYVCFAVMLLLMLVIPITREHRIIGFKIDNPETEEQPEVLTEMPDGSLTVNTTSLCPDVIGYSSPTPVEMTIVDGKIIRVKALPNNETPEFFGAVRNSDLLESLDGLTLEEASKATLDGVSGATYTSSAVIKNMKAAVAYASDEKNVMGAHNNSQAPLDAKFYVTLAIILAGALVPLFWRDPRYRTLQLVLNVLILGFWGGTFISYSLMVSFLTNGITQVALIPVALMLVAAFIYPMFGKVDYYCTWLCPYGALQELAGKCIKWKLRISTRVAKGLGVARRVLWFGLMWLLWTGLWFDWMGYEPFAAFFIRDASPAVLGIAGAFVVLSLIVQRPYCRFVCPTGSLFKLAEGRK